MADTVVNVVPDSIEMEEGIDCYNWTVYNMISLQSDE